MKVGDQQTSGVDLEITVARDFEEIEKIRPIWEKMQSEEPYPIINADIDRFLSVIESSEGRAQPYIIVIQKNGQLVTMLLARIGKNPIELKLGYKTLLSPKLKCLTVIYRGILGQPTSDVCSLLVGQMLRILSSQEIDVVYFNHLRTDSYIYRLSRELPGVLCRGHFLVCDAHWKTYLPDSYQEFLRSRSKNTRYNIR